MNETGAAGRHVATVVQGNASVRAFIGDRFFYGAAPDNAPYPFAVYSALPSRDVPVAGSDGRIIVEARWLVVVFLDRNDADLVRRIAGALDAALVGSAAVVEIDSQDYFVQTVYREEPYERSGPVDGEFYLNAGGVYRTPVYAIL